jgi:hypothetical protein
VPAQGAIAAAVNCDGRIDLISAATDAVSRTLVPTTGTPQTWTQTLDNSVDLFLNLTAVCSASDALNTVQCKEAEWCFW